MSLNTTIEWCDTTENPIMGCAGCELFRGPAAITDAVGNTLSSRGIQFGFRRAMNSLVTHFTGGNRDDVEAGRILFTTSQIYHARRGIAGQIEVLHGFKAGQEALRVIEQYITCYAAKLHLNRGSNFLMPERVPKDGYARSFEEVTRFPGRLEKVARAADLLGEGRPEKPWIDGLPGLVFVSDRGDAFSKNRDFDYLEEEVEASIGSEMRARHLWLRLTKRPLLMAKFAERLGGFPPNVCVMTSVTGRGTVGRVDQLRKVSARVGAFSIEPLRERIPAAVLDLAGIDWVIVGGESGSRINARPFDIEWVEELHELCARSKVAFFLKQLGWTPVRRREPIVLRNSHGSDWQEWPGELRVREFPEYFRNYRSDQAATSRSQRLSKNHMDENDTADFERLDSMVGCLAQSLVPASVALREIRDRRLYRAQYGTFEDYCRDAHGLSRQHVNNLIKAGKTLAEMETIVSKAGAPLPANEAQLRELARVEDPEERSKCYLDLWANVQEKGGKEITAGLIRSHLDGLERKNASGLVKTLLRPKERIKQALTVISELETEVPAEGKLAELVARLKQLLAE